MDPTLLITAAGVIGVPSIAGLTFWVGRITKSEGDTKVVQAATAQAMAAAIAAQATATNAHARLDSWVREFGEYREHVAREYVTHAAIIQFEARMGAEFRRLDQRLDRLFEPKKQG